MKEQKRFDLAIKFENAHYEDYKIDNWNGGIGEIKFYVNSIYFFDLKRINEEDKQLILEIMNALPHEYYEINSLEFGINQNIKQSEISNTVYIFVDEAGDMDFSPKGSKHYMFNFLVKTRPFQLHEFVANYRYELIERNLEPSTKEVLDIEKFHACEDNKYIRQKMFEIISTFAKDAVQVYSYILEKPKVQPEKRKEQYVFFADNLTFAITNCSIKLRLIVTSLS